MTNAEYNKAYNDALASELEDRSLAFLCDAEDICGIQVSPLTLELLERLRLARSPFIVGGKISHFDVAHFLWIVCTEFSTDKTKRAQWLLAQDDLPVDKAIQEIDEYLDRAFLDAREIGKKARPMVAMSASIALEMAKEPYRLHWREVIKTPLSILFQLIKAKDISEGATVINKRSDKVTSDWLAIVNAKTKPKPKRKNGKK